MRLIDDCRFIVAIVEAIHWVVQQARQKAEGGNRIREFVLHVEFRDLT